MPALAYTIAWRCVITRRKPCKDNVITINHCHQVSEIVIIAIINTITHNGE